MPMNSRQVFEQCQRELLRRLCSKKSRETIANIITDTHFDGTIEKQGLCKQLPLMKTKLYVHTCSALMALTTAGRKCSFCKHKKRVRDGNPYPLVI